MKLFTNLKKKKCSPKDGDKNDETKKDDNVVDADFEEVKEEVVKEEIKEEDKEKDKEKSA